MQQYEQYQNFIWNVIWNQNIILHELDFELIIPM